MYIAIDLGASSGRVMLCDGASLTEAHRFAHRLREDGAYLRWDWAHLLREVTGGIRETLRLAAEAGEEVCGIGVDTWGVDFGLLGADGVLLDDPVCYRSPALSGLAATLPGDLYARTGLPPLDINTLTQLVALRRDQPQVLEKAHTLLLIGDLLVYHLTGGCAVGAELSAASTTQLLLPDGSGWNIKLTQELSLPAHILPPLRRAGTYAGRLAYAGLPPVAVYTVAQHDTAAAFCAAAQPGGVNEHTLTLSCGTWGLLGVALDAPLLHDPAFSNERGADGRVLYLQNIPGLWRMQELRRTFAAEGHAYSYDDMERLARAADTAAGRQIRAAYDDLAQAIATAAQGIARATGRVFATLRVVGGGVRDALLLELLAEATGLRVCPGEAEAAAWGVRQMLEDR